MPNKTIYVSEDDLPLFERAQEIAGGNLSATIARAIRRFVDAEQGRQIGYQEVSIRAGAGPVRRSQRFTGLLIGEWRHRGGGRSVERLRVYRTRKGNFALHMHRTPDWAAWSEQGANWGWQDRTDSDAYDWVHGWGPSEDSLEVFPSFQDMRDRIPAEFFETLLAEAERPAIESLDI